MELSREFAWSLNRSDAMKRWGVASVLRSNECKTYSPHRAYTRSTARSLLLGSTSQALRHPWTRGSRNIAACDRQLHAVLAVTTSTGLTRAQTDIECDKTASHFHYSPPRWLPAHDSFNMHIEDMLGVDVSVLVDGQKLQEYQIEDETSLFPARLVFLRLCPVPDSR